MRIGWHEHLLGPFYASGTVWRSRRRRRGRARRNGPGCLLWLAIAIAIGAATGHSWLWTVAGVILFSAVAGATYAAVAATRKHSTTAARRRPPGPRGTGTAS